MRDRLSNLVIYIILLSIIFFLIATNVTTLFIVHNQRRAVRDAIITGKALCNIVNEIVEGRDYLKKHLNDRLYYNVEQTITKRGLSKWATLYDEQEVLW